MAAKAFYGCEFTNYNSDKVTHSDFIELLAKTISFRPKLWNLVKYSIESNGDVNNYEHVFIVLFNHVIDEDELNEFIEPFNNLQTTSLHGLEL